MMLNLETSSTRRRYKENWVLPIATDGKISSAIKTMTWHYSTSKMQLFQIPTTVRHSRYLGGFIDVSTNMMKLFIGMIVLAILIKLLLDRKSTRLNSSH